MNTILWTVDLERGRMVPPAGWDRVATIVSTLPRGGLGSGGPHVVPSRA